MSSLYRYCFLIVFFSLLPGTSLLAQNDSTDQTLRKLTQSLQSDKNNIALLLKRAGLLFNTNQHQAAINDYDRIIRISPESYQAYFGRGMALGRIGKVQQGIDDISVFIKHNPASSLAFTKRGVRYLWQGDLNKAANDFIKAIDLNPKNAEAHDDLGVIYAQQNKPEKAISHFQQTIKYEPTYQKAYHNLSLTYFIYDNSLSALDYVNKALKLSPNSKDTLLLKSEILKSLGQLARAKEIREDAMFLPDGNWSESMAIQLKGE